MMTTGKPYPKEIIQKIREEVLKGKTKYRVAKEMGIHELVVYSHTSDLPGVILGEPCIKGKSLDLLKQLLDVGYASSNEETHFTLRKLKKNLPMIQRAQIDGHSIYYLSDKNKNALQAMITQKKSRIISYQELKSITKVFGVNLSTDEKQKYVRVLDRHSIPIIRKKNGGFLSSLKKNQARLDDFTGKDGFLGRNQVKGFRKLMNEKGDSLRENEDSLAFFYIRKYCSSVVPKVDSENIKKRPTWIPRSRFTHSSITENTKTNNRYYQKFKKTRI